MKNLRHPHKVQVETTRCLSSTKPPVHPPLNLQPGQVTCHTSTSLCPPKPATTTLLPPARVHTSPPSDTRLLPPAARTKASGHPVRWSGTATGSQSEGEPTPPPCSNLLRLRGESPPPPHRPSQHVTEVWRPPSHQVSLSNHMTKTICLFGFHGDVSPPVLSCSRPAAVQTSRQRRALLRPADGSRPV